MWLLISALATAGPSSSSLSAVGMEPLPALQFAELSWLCPNERGARVVSHEQEPSLPDGACGGWVAAARGEFQATFARPVEPLRRDLQAKDALERIRTDVLAKMDRLGIPKDQIGKVEVRNMMVTSSQESSEAFVYGVTAWVGRLARGVEVGEHHAVFTYSPKGELLQARGRWPQLDVARSTWALPAQGPCSSAGLHSALERVFGEERHVQSQLLLIPRALEGGGYAVDLKTLVEYDPPGAHRPNVQLCDALVGGTP